MAGSLKQIKKERKKKREIKNTWEEKEVKKRARTENRGKYLNNTETKIQEKWKG